MTPPDPPRCPECGVNPARCDQYPGGSYSNFLKPCSECDPGAASSEVTVRLTREEAAAKAGWTRPTKTGWVEWTPGELALTKYRAESKLRAALTGEVSDAR